MRVQLSQIFRHPFVNQIKHYFGQQFVKAVFFGLLLLYVQARDFSIFSISIFVLAALFMYLQPIFKTFSMLTLWLLTVVMSLLVTSQFAIGFSTLFPESDLRLSRVIFAVLFASFFYIVLALKDLLLMRRKEWFTVLQMGLLYGALALFFTANLGEQFLLNALLLTVFLYLHVRELFRFHRYERSRLLAVYTVLMTLISIEIVWAISLLPIGFSNSASLATLIIIAFTEVVSRYLKGDLTARYVRLIAGFCTVLIAGIFLVSDWTL